MVVPLVRMPPAAVVHYLPLVADNLLEAVSHAIVVVGACTRASLELPVISVRPKPYVSCARGKPTL